MPVSVSLVLPVARFVTGNRRRLCSRPNDKYPICGTYSAFFSRTPQELLGRTGSLSNFTYTYQVDDDDTYWTWFGNKGSDNFFKGTLNEGGTVLTGRWQWPGGGFDVVSRKISD